MGNPQITAIFVGGNMEARHYDDVDTALSRYPQGTIVTAFMPQQVAGTFTRSPFTRDAFLSAVPALIGQAAPDGILHFIQFGHGGTGPSLITQDRDIIGENLVHVFEEGVSEYGSPAYTAIILGGCYSGGFGHFFLESDTFTPDFFLGSSPQLSVAFQGLANFVGVMRSLTDHDSSGGDGILTLRERAIHDMNHSNPLAVMFARPGSADIDIQGRPATAPYFAKEVEELTSHQDFISMMENLRFGEQAVVYIEGKEENPEFRAWFENEATNGDGFYKFVSIPDNEESRSFFQTGGQPAIYVVGPNLRYTGIPLTSDRPIGEQIPEIVANENLLVVSVGWKAKIEQTAGSDYLNTIFSETNFDYQSAIQSAISLYLRSEDKFVEQALSLTIILFEHSNNIDYSTLQTAMRMLAQVTLYSDTPLSSSNVALLLAALEYDTSADADRLQAAIFRMGFAGYGEGFSERTKSMSWSSPNLESLWVADLRGENEENRLQAMREMTAVDFQPNPEIIGVLRDLVQNHPSPELRLAITSYLRERTGYESVWAAILSGGEADPQSTIQEMTTANVSPNAEINQVLIGFVQNQPSPELRQAIISYIRTRPGCESVWVAVLSTSGADQLYIIQQMADAQIAPSPEIIGALNGIMQNNPSIELRDAVISYIRSHQGFESVWLAALSGAGADQLYIVRQMVEANVRPNPEIIEDIATLMQNQPSVEARRAVTSYIRSFSGDFPVADILKFLAGESDDEAKANLLTALAAVNPRLEDILPLRDDLENIVEDETASEPLQVAAQTVLAKIDALERQKEEIEDREWRASLHENFRFAYSPVFLPFGMFNPIEATGTGGLGGGIDGLLAVKVWGEKTDNDREEALFIGVMGGLNVGAHWDYGWFTMWPNANLAVMWERVNRDLAVLVSAGYVSRYTPVVSAEEVHHGWQLEVTFFMGGEFDYSDDTIDVYYVRHRDLYERIGLLWAFQYFPEDNEMAAFVGARYLLGQLH